MLHSTIFAFLLYEIEFKHFVTLIITLLLSEQELSIMLE